MFVVGLPGRQKDIDTAIFSISMRFQGFTHSYYQRWLDMDIEYTQSVRHWCEFCYRVQFVGRIFARLSPPQRMRMFA